MTGITSGKIHLIKIATLAEIKWKPSNNNGGVGNKLCYYLDWALSDLLLGCPGNNNQTGIICT